MVQDHRLRVGLLAAAGLLLLGLIWIGVTALLARNALQDLDTRYDRLQTAISDGDIARARAIAADIPAVAERAHDLTTGPAWWTAAQLPYFGEPVEVARGVAAASGRVGTEVVPNLLEVADAIDPAALRVGGSGIKIEPLLAAAPRLRTAATTVNAVVADLRGLPTDTWLSAVDTGRSRIGATLLSVRGYVDAASRVSRVLPQMLGAKRPQTYFIGLQNEAELRGTGGLPGAFAIATTRGGALRFDRFESNAAFNPPGPSNLIPTGLDFGPEYRATYGASEPTSSFVNSNVSPHFPYTAQIWATMWQRVSGQRVDGVIALDPTALAYFLLGTGPTTVRGVPITAQNVVSLLQRDQYSLFAERFIDRKTFVVDVLRAVSRKLEAGSGSGLSLLRAATRSAQEQRLLAWSRDATVERALVETNFAGALPPPNRPLAGLVLNNASAGKIDFYLTRSLQYVRTGCGANRDVVATIELANNAPASGLPAEVANRADTPPRGARPGDVRQIVDFYASRGAQLLSVTVDDRRAEATQLTERDRPVYRFDLEIPRGTTRTIVLHLTEPAGVGSAVIWRQPGVTPLTVDERQQDCS